MIHANIPLDSIKTVAMSGAKNLSRIVVVTSDGLKYFIPCECFSSTEIEQLLRELRKA